MKNVIELNAFKHMLPLGWAITHLAEHPQGGWDCRMKDPQEAKINGRGFSPHQAVTNALGTIAPLGTA